MLSLEQFKTFIMKKIVILSVFTLFSTLLNAQNNYEKLWKKVLEFEKKGLPQTALKEVEKIYSLAKAENNASQIIKSILYKSKYALTLEEDAQLTIIKNLKQEIEQAKTPQKNILESILANLYWQYFNQNRWRFYQRTNTEKKIDTTDFRTWDLHTIFKEIDKHHQNALQNALVLQQTKLKTFDKILNTHKNSKKYRPTVYDFIAHNALEFYKTGESNLPQPANKFEILDSKFLGDVTSFLKADFNTQDTESQKLKALKLYKDLTLFHLKDKDKTPLVAVTLERLKFVKENARFNNVNEIYLQTLKKLQKQYRKSPISTEIDYLIADFYVKQARKFTPENPVNQFKFRDALEVCEIAKINFPNSAGAQKCANLKSQILAKSYNITSELHIEINKPSFAKIDYRNVDKLYFRVYKTSFNFEKRLQTEYNREVILNDIKKQEFITDFNQKLQNLNDFQSHTSEIILPKLKQGYYVILASDNGNFNQSNSYAYSFLQVTNLALTETIIKGKHIYQIVNRETGKPILNAKVHFENFNTNRYNKKIDKTLISDYNGFVSMEPNDYYNQVAITVTKNSEKAIFKYFSYNKYRDYNDQPYKNKRIFLFTDRSIYRPSQTVYFKGIAVKQHENTSEIITNKKITVTLKDVNYQVVKTLDLVTNEYGSFSGEFILPNSGLTGNFTVQANGKNNLGGYLNFSVEEYKRPKFYAKFNLVTKTYKINDTVTVKGIATAYAGSLISDAKVVYRVKRLVQYPKWYYWFRPSGFSSEAQEIITGETTTNDKGEFNIRFKAIPDLSVKKENNPIFTYQITADITDINGETRSTSTTVKVGYHSVVVSVTVPDKIDKYQKETKISLATNNLNGEFVSATGTLKIYKVKAPLQPKRERPWNAPDLPLISKEKWEKTFPHDYYQSFNPFKEKGKLIFTSNFNTGKSKEILLKKLKKEQSGKYLVIAEVKDSNGKTITDKKIFSLVANDDKKVADKQLFIIEKDKENYQPNEVVCLKLGSASKDISVVIRVEKDKKIVKTQIIHLSNEVQSLDIPVTDKDYGGFVIHYQFVNYNSYKQGRFFIDVPYPKTKLEIETLTFRDKLQPNQEETWSFKIKGPNGDKVLAEVLASMYDASLDQFKAHSWQFNPVYHRFYYPLTQNRSIAFGKNAFRNFIPPTNFQHVSEQQFDTLNWFGFYFGNSYYGGVQPMVMESADLEEIVVRGVTNKRGTRKEKRSVAKVLSGKVAGLIVNEAEEDKKINDNLNQETTEQSTGFSDVKVRTNFNETAFFFPHLTTDKDGNVQFTFTTPESLTKWKLQLLAHTKTLNSGLKTLEAVTQKDLMVLPNTPRFLRQGDTIVLMSKIANLSNKTLQGMVQLELTDALTNKNIDTALGNTNATQSFSVDAQGNTNIQWKLHIPDTVQAVQYKIVAKAGDFSDGEQHVLPVLTNRMLVTETLPMWIRSNQTKTFTLKKLKNTTSKTRKNFKLTLEMTSNPAWYAVQALPYLMEYPYECSEQTFSRYYANTLASYIANSNPQIQHVFNQWKNSDALISNLEKNQELKSLIIQETPWLRDAQSETEQKKRIALLFDLNKMKNEQKRALNKLKKMQMSSGGFPWFKGSRYENRYITQHIVAGIGHLKHLHVIDNESEITTKALNYLDNQISKDYQELLNRANKLYANEDNKQEKIDAYLKKNHTSHFQIHYLYARSFYPQAKASKKAKTAIDYFTNQAYTYWLNYKLYTKGLISLLANRNNNFDVSEAILRSLKETSITNDELGMYWKENTASYYWYQAPIETQALLIEVFSEVANKNNNNLKDIDNLKIWLLKNKQTNRWKTTKATTEAVYALLLQGTDWIQTTEFVKIKIGNKTMDPLQLNDTKVEAGTGYFKTSWNGDEIKPEMATVTISKKEKGIAWGALYWQYFEDLDKISSAETPLKLSKKLFLKTNGNRGKELKEITSDTKLQLGDLITVRVELRADRAMEFIHLKDMRASGLEPINVISRYKWQDGLGYYQNTKDASTNFFISYLPKGIYVFEYDLRVNNIGDFSNGITTIQSMYAPEFSSHSEGVRVKIE